MQDNRPEVERALVRFREDILKALTDLKVEIVALQHAVQEAKPVTQQRLSEFRNHAKEAHREKIHDEYTSEIRSAHEVRD